MNSEVTAAWAVLFVAGVFEVAWALGLEYADGFSNLKASVLTVIAMLLSFVLLSKAVATLPVGTAYVVWIGIGAVGTVLGGILLFDEPVTVHRLAFLILVIIGVIGLKTTVNT